MQTKKEELKDELFDILWIRHDWCMMGYDKQSLKEKFTIEQLKLRIKYAEESEK